MKGIADTGFLVAFLNRRDLHHKWARALAATVDEPLLTCEAVLAETAYHIQSVALTLRLIETGLVRLSFSLAPSTARIQALASRYADRNPDLADLCLICLSEANPTLPILTVDSDFQIYRRNHRDLIPIILPG